MEDVGEKAAPSSALTAAVRLSSRVLSDIVTARNRTPSRCYFATVGIAREGTKRWLVTAPWIKDSADLGECLLGWWLLNDYGYLADRTGTVSADRVAKAETLDIQGICADEGIVWLCTSRGEGDHTLATFKIVDDGTWIGNIFDWTFDWARYGEGLTYAPSSDHLTGCSDCPNHDVHSIGTPPDATTT